MTTATDPKEAADLDLELVREIDAPRELVWKAWTDPEHLKQWWAPQPFKTTECVMDLRPGGRFYTRMQGPDGEDFPGDGVFLEVIENQRIVFTDALLPGWRPADEPFMTAIVTFEEHEGGTCYTARALHKDAGTRQKHLDMGFDDGWNQAVDQLIEVVEGLKP